LAAERTHFWLWLLHLWNILGALDFVPPSHVVKRFNSITHILPAEFDGILKYFKSTYIKGRNGRPPLFSINLWNVYDRVRKKLPRTSNYIEGWHNRFRLSLQSLRPSMWKFLFVLHKEQERTESLLFKMNFGKALQLQKCKYRQINKNIQNLCKKYRQCTKTVTQFYTWIRSFSKHIPRMSDK